MKKDKPYDRTVYQSLTMILQFGINMVVPIAMMTALGIWLDRKFEKGYFTMILFVVGVIAGGQNIYRMAKSIYSAPAGKDRKDRIEKEKAGKEEQSKL